MRGIFEKKYRQILKLEGPRRARKTQKKFVFWELRGVQRGGFRFEPETSAARTLETAAERDKTCIRLNSL